MTAPANKYEPFLAVPLRVNRARRRGDIDIGRLHLLIDLALLAATEDFSLQTPIAYRLSALADVLDYQFTESKLSKDLKWLAGGGYLELVPGSRSRPWEIKIGPKARLERRESRELGQNDPLLSGLNSDGSRTELGRADTQEAPELASDSGKDPHANSDGTRPEVVPNFSADVKTETETETESNTNPEQKQQDDYELPDILKTVNEKKHSNNGFSNTAIATLINHLADADRNTGRTLRNLRLPDTAYLEAGSALRKAKLTEHIRSDSGYVVNWLQQWQREKAA